MFSGVNKRPLDSSIFFIVVPIRDLGIAPFFLSPVALSFRLSSTLCPLSLARLPLALAPVFRY